MSLFGKKKDKDTEKLQEQNVQENAEKKESFLDGMFSSQTDDDFSDLLENKSVLLNLEDMDDRLIQRAIDTLGGAAFALNATLRRASDRTYLIAPLSVDIAYTNDADRR